MPRAIDIRDVSHSFASRRALYNVSVEIQPGERFAFVGPNGSGKTTLFRLISTLFPLSAGEIDICGDSVAATPSLVRQHLGVVFQSPCLDRFLTVRENIELEGSLFGLSGATCRSQTALLADRFGFTDRLSDLAAKLSGGMRRRVEIAKTLLHSPEVILLDEPTGPLDPSARRALWELLDCVRRQDGVTVVFTTHLLEEAEQADRVAILDEGRLIACDSPAALRSSLGSDILSVRPLDVAAATQSLHEAFGILPQSVDGSLRVTLSADRDALARYMQKPHPEVASLSVASPTLEDVFLDRTGRCFTPVEPSVKGASHGHR